MRRSSSSDNNRGEFREVDANLLEAHLSPALILDGISEPRLHALASLRLYFCCRSLMRLPGMFSPPVVPFIFNTTMEAW